MKALVPKMKSSIVDYFHYRLLCVVALMEVENRKECEIEKFQSSLTPVCLFLPAD